MITLPHSALKSIQLQLTRDGLMVLSTCHCTSNHHSCHVLSSNYLNWHGQKEKKIKEKLKEIPFQVLPKSQVLPLKIGSKKNYQGRKIVDKYLLRNCVGIQVNTADIRWGVIEIKVSGINSHYERARGTQHICQCQGTERNIWARPMEGKYHLGKHAETKTQVKHVQYSLCKNKPHFTNFEII